MRRGSQTDVPDPLAGLPDSIRLDDLSQEIRGQASLAVIQFITGSHSLEQELRELRGRDVRNLVRRRVRLLWREARLGHLWRRLSPADRSRLVSGAIADLQRFASLAGMQEYRLPFLHEPMAWLGKAPVTDVVDVARAVLRRALDRERRRALAVTGADVNDLIGDFMTKLAEVQADPSSPCYLTQPYLQAMARNSLRDAARAGRRDAAAHSGALLDPDDLGEVDAAVDLVALPRELAADLGVDEAIINIVIRGGGAPEVAAAAGTSLAEAERLRDGVRRVLRERSASSG